MAYYVPGKFVYLATPHTASSSTITVFRKWERDRGFGREIKTHHILLPDIKKQLQEDPHLPQITSEVVWTVLRNPYDLVVTWWFRRGIPRGRSDFRSFASSWRDEPYVVNGKMYFHLPDAKRILFYERLVEDLQKLARDLDLPTIELPMTNPTLDKKPWQTYYNDTILGVVNERWGAEFEPYYERITSSSMLPKIG